MSNIHRLLERQLRKHLRGEPGPELQRLLQAVNDAYQQQDQDRQLVERAMELASQELFERNRALGAAQDLLLAEVEQRKRTEYRYTLGPGGQRRALGLERRDRPGLLLAALEGDAGIRRGRGRRRAR